MKLFLRGIGYLVYIISRGYHKLIVMPLGKAMFAKCGKNVYIGQKCCFTGTKNIFIGSNVSIGSNANFITTRAKIILGDHIMFGPHVFIITGDHRIDILGRYMNTVTDAEKLPENDADVIIDNDVWIGTNAIILKGVHIHTGSVISAGSVVVNDVEPYSIYAGVPAKKIKNRFTQEQIDVHETILGIKN